MASNRRKPLSVAICHAWIGVAAAIVPGSQREEWKQEWLAEIWHRWQFLLHAGEWVWREEVRLFKDCAGAFPDAAWYFLSQETVQHRWHEGMRSPWTCLGGLAALILALVASTHGLPACMQMAQASVHAGSNRVVLLWAQPFGRRPHGLPANVITRWRKSSGALEVTGSFNIGRPLVQMDNTAPRRGNVVTTDEQFFHVLGVRPLLGLLDTSGVALDYLEWTSRFHSDPRVIGRTVLIGSRNYKVSAVLPRGFQFLSRERSIYVVERVTPGDQAVVAARVRPGTDLAVLERQLSKIAADANYEFLLNPQLRLTTFQQVLWEPVRVFGLAVAISALLSLCALRVRMRHAQLTLAAANRRDTFRRAGFFLGKLGVALALVFAAGLEWARPESSTLLTWTDGGNGPLLVWLYVFGSMASFFWAIVDQRGRCRVCLRFLAFPVRIGCPGCVLLEWAGTELLCSEGHGVLHVPHMATSWEEEADRWISFDDSWRGLFAGRTSG